MDAPPISPTALLTPIFGADTAAVISFLVFIGYVITWVAPLLPPPSDGASQTWKTAYAIITKIAGNIGYARNKAHPKEPAEP